MGENGVGEGGTGTALVPYMGQTLEQAQAWTRLPEDERKRQAMDAAQRHDATALWRLTENWLLTHGEQGAMSPRRMGAPGVQVPRRGPIEPHPRCPVPYVSRTLPGTQAAHAEPLFLSPTGCVCCHGKEQPEHTLSRRPSPRGRRRDAGGHCSALGSTPPVSGTSLACNQHGISTAL